MLEVESSVEAGLQSFVDAVEGIGERLGDVVHGDLSAALIGAPNIPGASPRRFHGTTLVDWLTAGDKAKSGVGEYDKPQ